MRTGLVGWGVAYFALGGCVLSMSRKPWRVVSLRADVE
jgi:hypothetical protein